jgi:hypothetical protein
MNAHWRVRRAVSARDTGQQRWDLAYQCLLRWVEDGREPARPPMEVKETHHGDRPVCAGLNPATATDPNH